MGDLEASEVDGLHILLSDNPQDRKALFNLSDARLLTLVAFQQESKSNDNRTMRDLRKRFGLLDLLKLLPLVTV